MCIRDRDNADLRLRKRGFEAGLIEQAEYDRLVLKEEQIEAEIKRVEHRNIGASRQVQEDVYKRQVKGSMLACWRILRCNPFSHGGYDPVP